MAASKSVSACRLGKRSRKQSETASLSSWGSEINVLSDAEEAFLGKPKRNRRSGLDSEHDYLIKPSSSSDDETSVHDSTSRSQTRGKRPKCFTRNAVMARQNRLKKKKYVQDLENEIQALRHENNQLKTSLNGYSKDVQVVRKENLYLRNVLANSSEISQLIRAVKSSTGLPTTTSLCRSRSTDNKLNAQHGNKISVDSIPYDVSTKMPATPLSFGSDQRGAPIVRRVPKDFPIAFDDVALSSSAADDNDELDALYLSKTSLSDVDLNNSLLNDIDDLGFGPNALGDWLEGDEALSDIGVCLHVAKQKVSLEFCSSCNENAFCNLDEGISV